MCPAELPGSPTGTIPTPTAHPKTGSLCFVCSAWKMAVLEAKSTPVRLHPPKRGASSRHGLRAGVGGGYTNPSTPHPGADAELGVAPRAPAPIGRPRGTGSKAPGARWGRRLRRSVSDREVCSGCHQQETEPRVTLFSGLG